jgi:protein tyrosine kinase modulator
MDNSSNTESTSFDLDLGGLEHYRLRDYRRLFLRQKWLIVFVTLGVALATAVVVYFIPNSYKAKTVILVDSQKVPDAYVRSTVSSSAVDRLATLREQVLSATRLGQVLDEMQLYPELRAKESQQDLITQMRKDIDVQIEGTNRLNENDHSFAAFSISFESRNPVEAARVTNRLASLFIEQNIKAREQQVLGTADFLNREVDDAKKNLDTEEEKIRQLRTAYSSELPASENLHVQAINSLQLELRGEMDAVNRAQQLKVFLQSQLRETPPIVNLDQAKPPELSGLQTLLGDEQGQLDELRRRYGADFPDVVKKEMEVQELKKRIAEVEKNNSQKLLLNTPPAQAQNPVLQTQIDLADQQIKKDEQRIAEIKQEIDFHESKLEKIPLYEQQMGSVMRDYDVARDEYMHLLDRKFDADMSADLESRQKGERFVVLDPAQVPDKPASPNRPLINLLSLPAGLLLGLVATVGKELFDPTVKTEQEVLSQLGTKLFGEIPWLPTAQEKRRLLVRAACSAAATLALMAGYSFLLIWTWRWPG